MKEKLEPGMNGGKAVHGPFAKNHFRAKPSEKKVNHLDITALIRSLQRAEGHLDCFQQEKADCDEHQCTWRAYCLNYRRVDIGKPR